MRIVIIIETFPSLSESFISNKVRELCKRGHDVFVFCNDKKSQLLDEIFGSESRLHVLTFDKQTLMFDLLLHPWSIIVAISKGGNWRKRAFWECKVRFINRQSPDIIHFGFSGIGISYLHYIEQLRGKKIVSCRGTAENVNLLSSLERQANIRALFRKVDAIHCVSAALKDSILPYCDKPEKLFVNNPSIDTRIFQRDRKVSDGSLPIILSVGRLMFQKGYLIGLLAIKKLLARTRNFKWIIVGNGMQRDELIFHVHELEMQENVLLVGTKSRDEIIELYNNASIFFLPSVSEGIANVALEAMSMELPVVATRCGGMEEVICHRQNGLLAENYNDTALAAHLVELLDDPHLRERLGKAGRRTVLEKFELSSQIDRFETIYHQLLDNSR